MPQTLTPLERPDAELLLAIATQRCALAFETFYKRWERPAYNLALRITCNRDGASEVVQESMLRIWRFAHNFNLEGNPRGWFLRLVAREGLQWLQRRRCEMARRERRQIEQPREDHQEPSPARSDREEALAILDRELQALSPLEQRLIALYYSGGLSQREIGLSLDLPKRTVSHKLAESIDRLKIRLQRAGFGAWAPVLLAEESLAGALGTGPAAPAGLWTSVLRSARGTGTSLPLPLQTGSWSLPLAGLVAAGLFVALAAAIALGLSRSETAVEAAAQAPEGRIEAVGPIEALHPAPRAPATPLSQPPLHWDFEALGSLEAETLAGAWSRAMLLRTRSWGLWVPENQGTPSELLLPLRLTPQPYLVTVRYCPLRAGSLMLDLFWTQNRARQGVRSVRFLPRTVRCKQHHSSLIYLFEDRVVTVEDGRPVRCMRYERPYPGDQLSLLVLNLFIDEFSIRPLSAQTIPEALRRQATFEGPNFRELGPQGNAPYPPERTHTRF